MKNYYNLCLCLRTYGAFLVLLLVYYQLALLQKVKRIYAPLCHIQVKREPEPNEHSTAQQQQPDAFSVCLGLSLQNGKDFLSCMSASRSRGWVCQSNSSHIQTVLVMRHFKNLHCKTLRVLKKSTPLSIVR